MKIKQTNEMKVIGVKGKCRMSNTMEDCSVIWKDLMKNKDKIKNKIDDKAYGVCTMIDKENFWTFACFEVSSMEDIPEGMDASTVPSLKVAVFEHKGKMENLKNTYEKIIKKDLPNEKQEIDWDKPVIEMYDERYKQDSDDSIMEIWMPIK